MKNTNFSRGELRKRKELNRHEQEVAIQKAAFELEEYKEDYQTRETVGE